MTTPPADTAASVVTPGSPQPAKFGFAISSWVRAGREGAWVAGGQLVTAIAGLIGIRVLTELAPKTVFGESTLLVGALMLVRNFFVTPIASAQARFHPDFHQRNQTQWFSKRITRYTWMATGVCAVVGLIAYAVNQALTGGGVRPVLLASLMIFLAVDTSRNLRTHRLMAERKRALQAIWSSCEAILFLGCSAALLAVDATTESYMLGQAIGALAALVIFGFMLYPPVPEDAGAAPEMTERELWHKVVTYGAPFAPLAAVTWLANLGDRYVIGGWLGLGSAGVYAAASSLASRPFVILTTVLVTFARPILFEAESRNQREKGRRIFLLWVGATAAIGGAGVLLLLLLGKLIARLFLAAEYRQDAPAILFWVGLAYALYAVVQAVQNRMLSLHLSKRIVWPEAAAALASVGLCAVLIPWYGIVGAAQAHAAGFALELIIMVLGLYTLRQKVEPDTEAGALSPPQT